MGKGKRIKNKRRKQEIYDFVFEGYNEISTEMEMVLNNLVEHIFKEFGSKKRYISHFENINIGELIKSKNKNENYLEKYKFGFLMVPKKILKYPKGKIIFRIMKQDSSWYQENSQLFSNPNPTWNMRFSRKGERMLYVTSCRNVGIGEAKVIGKQIFTEIEYELNEELSISKLGYEDVKVEESNRCLYKFAGKIYSDLISENADENEDVYEITNKLKDIYLNDEQKNIDGYTYTSKYICENENCLRDSIGILLTSETKLLPKKIHKYQMNEESKFMLNQSYEIKVKKDGKITLVGIEE